MVKIQLEGGYLEVKEGTNCPLNFGVGDVRDVAKKTGTFSKTITLIGSSNNNNLLNHYYDVNIVEGTFNINALTKCTLLQNDVPIVSDAYLQLLSVDKIQQSDSYEDVIEYQVLVKDAQSDFFTKIDNSLLEDIDLSYLDHTYSASNVVASFSNTITDGYTYPLTPNPTTNYPLSEFKPAVYAKTYWDKIHQLAGFTYEWTDLSDAYFDKLIIPFNGDVVNYDYSDFLVDADYSNSIALTQPVGINVDSTSGNLTGWTENVDAQSLFDPTTGTYDVPFNISVGQSIDLTFNVEYAFGLSNGTGATAYLVGSGGGYTYRPRFQVFKNGTLLTTQNILIGISYTRLGGTSIGTGVTTLGNPTIQFTLPCSNLLPTDVLTIRAYVDVTSLGTQRWQDAASSGSDVQIDLEFDIIDLNVQILPSSNILESGAPVEVNKFIPRQIKQKDFIKSFCTMYNLFVEQDVDNPQKLIYRHRDEYYDSGAVKDWTLKLAKDRAQSLQFLPELSAKKLLLTYKPDRDIPNATYEDSVREIYGQVEFTFDNEYVKGIDRKELIFSPTPITTTSFGAVVPMFSGATPKMNIRVLIHDGTRSCNAYNIYDYGTTGETNVTTYPMVHHMNDPFNASFDINFAICDFYYYQNIGLTNNNLFNNYWRRTVNQINRGKMLSAYFDLEENDIQTLRLNDKIRIDNSWWNINRIQDYNANSRTLTKVELLSIDDELSLPATRVTRPIGNADIKRAGRFIMESFYRNNNVNLSEGSVIVKGIGNVVNEGLEGFVQGDYKVITDSGYTGVNVASENFANTDLTFTGNRSHDTDGNFFELTTDNGAYGEGYIYLDPTEMYAGIGSAYVYSDGSDVSMYVATGQAVKVDSDGTLTSNFGRVKSYSGVNATLTLNETYHVVNCTNTITVNLPTAADVGREYIIKNSGAGTITVDPDGAETIDGAATFTLATGACITIVSTGTNWIITSRG
jgi:hypothetical protein